jgi:RNA polymerase-binding transcription factor DksA
MDTKKYEAELLKTKSDLEGELGKVGKRNPKNKNDWVATGADEEMEMHPDRNEEADQIEELAERVGIEGILEERLGNVNKALERIKDGTYGFCTEKTTGKHSIETKRLEANPAADTCLKHMRA